MLGAITMNRSNPDAAPSELMDDARQPGGPLSRVNPSPDAGLVERLREHERKTNHFIAREAAAALEAKDAEIERLNRQVDRLLYPRDAIDMG
jgi:hypothetical protein